MNKTSTQQLGFTLVEMMIVVAILAILSVIAIPSYNRYIERGYQSQAHAELVAINSAFKNQMVKNPKWETNRIEKELNGFISSYKGHKDLADKYQYSAEMIDTNKCRASNKSRASNKKPGLLFESHSHKNWLHPFRLDG